MGKKKANAAKKKQVAKTNRLSSAYGVSVLKGGTISRNNGVIDTKSTLLADSSSHAKNPHETSTNGEGKAKNTALTCYDRNSSEMLLSTREISGHRPRVSHVENDEFQRLYASLEERSLALQARKDEQRRSKKVRMQQQKKGWGKFERPSATIFAEATLTLAPKTTQELVDDATNRVAQGMIEIGQRTTNALDASAMPGQSSLAAAAGLDWKLRVSSMTDQANVPQNNSYAALDIESDSDNDWAEAENKPKLIFEPASFSFRPSVTPLTLSHSADDINPDL
ncbi:hypothetical protein ACHAW5_004557 [Stephanodiscus triporus]|uniref:Uncharacterized protein n=1 Tax=Stephanodiscus triporus TaxID=2934178 RepID=A0ABD3NWB1_9STRA